MTRPTSGEPEEPSGPRAGELLTRREAWPLVEDLLDRWVRGRACLPELPPLRLYHEGRELKGALRQEPPVSVNAEVVEYQLDSALHLALQERVPQALLRDLHRPERNFSFVNYEIHQDSARVSMSEAAREVRLALHREAAPVVESLLPRFLEFQAWRRRFLAAPWRPFRSDSAPREYAEILHEGLDAAEFFFSR